MAVGRRSRCDARRARSRPTSGPAPGPQVRYVAHVGVQGPRGARPHPRQGRSPRPTRSCSSPSATPPWSSASAWQSAVANAEHNDAASTPRSCTCRPASPTRARRSSAGGPGPAAGPPASASARATSRSSSSRLPTRAARARRRDKPPGGRRPRRRRRPRREPTPAVPASPRSRGRPRDEHDHEHDHDTTTRSSDGRSTKTVATSRRRTSRPKRVRGSTRRRRRRRAEADGSRRRAESRGSRTRGRRRRGDSRATASRSRDERRKRTRSNGPEGQPLRVPARRHHRLEVALVRRPQGVRATTSSRTGRSATTS